MIVFGEQLTAVQVVGGALVVGAVVLAETGRGSQTSDRSLMIRP